MYVCVYVCVFVGVYLGVCTYSFFDILEVGKYKVKKDMRHKMELQDGW